VNMVPVGIIGGGPVGLTLAALLARQNIACVVIEADESYCTGSRAICMSRRSQEIAAWAAFDTPMLAKALPWTDGSSHFGSTEVLRFSMPHDASQRFFPMVNIQQYFVEQYAHEASQAAPQAGDVRWSTRMTSLENLSGSVRLKLEHAGTVSSLDCRYVVACDGGRSTARELLGLPLKGTQYEGRYVIVDIRQKTSRPTERLAWFDPPSNPGSTILMHRQPEDVWRIDYQLREDEDPEQAVRPENVLARVKAHLEWIGENQPWEALWISIYNAKCLTLDEYRHGNLFFAGDAAHMVPIFGVRGLNSGVDDVGNIAWKLARVLNGQAPDALLDTYSPERRGAALVNIAYGSKSTEFMAPPHCGFALMREAALRLATSTPAVRQLLNPRQSTPVSYEAKALLGPDIGFSASAAAAPGTVAPDARIALKPANYMSQLFGTHYLVLHFWPTTATPEFSNANIVRLNQANDPFGECYARYAVTADTVYLIRPDGYVAARWANANWPQIMQVAAQQFHLREK
jgi:3-(3-hydroxy-phenyl)propionate hydroxylase